MDEQDKKPQSRRATKKVNDPKPMGYADQHRLLATVHSFFAANAKIDSAQMKRVGQDIVAQLESFVGQSLNG